LEDIAHLVVGKNNADAYVAIWERELANPAMNAIRERLWRNARHNVCNVFGNAVALFHNVSRRDHVVKDLGKGKVQETATISIVAKKAACIQWTQRNYFVGHQRRCGKMEYGHETY
jgi:hypothetical protein